MWRTLAFAAVMLSMPAAAQLYKWVDEKGVTHYSETPPPSGSAKELAIKPRSSPVPPPASSPGPAAGTKEAAGQGSAGRRPPVKEVDPRDLIAGSWKSPAGEKPELELVIQPFGSRGDVILGQYWTGRDGMDMGQGMSFQHSGTSGKGSLTFEGELRVTKSLATRFDYVLEGDTLVVSATSTTYQGRYRLRR